MIVIGLAGLVAASAAPAAAQTDTTTAELQTEEKTLDTTTVEPMPVVIAPAASPELLTTSTAAVVAGDTAWLALNWKAADDLTDFRVTADVKSATVTYSETTGDYAGPYQSANLRAGEIDFTSIRVEVPYDGLDGVKAMPMEVTASWLVGDRRATATYKAEIPLIQHEGDDVSLLTSELEVPAGEATWVEVSYAGIAPIVGEFAVAVDVGPGLDVVYPGDGTFASLNNDAVLEDGEKDVARFLLDATQASPGTSTIELHTMYVKGSGQMRLRAVLELTVTS